VLVSPAVCLRLCAKYWTVLVGVGLFSNFDVWSVPFSEPPLPSEGSLGLGEEIKQVENLDEIIIEKWLTFTLIDARWNIQVWADSAKPVSGKVYRLRIKVRGERNSEVAAAR